MRPHRAIAFLVVVVSFLAAAQGVVWTVGRNSSVSLTDALAKLTSHSVIYLEPGEHRIERFRLFQDLTNVSIIGRGANAYDFNVTCADNIGLAFVNVSNLTLENFHILRCSLSGVNLQQAVDRLQETVVLFHNILEDTYVGLFVGHCTDVVMLTVAIINTPGVGMVGVNVMGSFRMSNVKFIGNIRRLENCSFVLQQTYEKDGRQIGGGAFLAYYDYQPATAIQTEYDNKIVTLEIELASFINNSDCTYDVFNAMNARESNFVRDQGYGLGGGGGLSLVMTQQQYGVVARVDSTVFLNNTARLGAGALIGIYSGVLNAKVTFLKCHLYRNGFSSMDLNLYPLISFTYAGAGITIANDIFRPDSVDVLRLQLQRNVSIDIHDTDFIGNGAIFGGGAYIFSSYISPVISKLDVTYVNFENCLFEYNVASSGSALFVTEYKVNGILPGFQITVTSITVRYSEQVFANERILVPSANGDAVHIVATNFTLMGASLFESNLVTAIGCTSALLGSAGSVTFMRNTGVFGGALFIAGGSRVVIGPDSSIRFIENVGQSLGGAIYVDNPPVHSTVTVTSCFLFFDYGDFLFCRECLDISKLHIYVEVSNNKAPYGSILYGVSLEGCPWATALRAKLQPLVPQIQGMNLLEIFHLFSQGRFKFDPAPDQSVKPSQLETPPISLQINDTQSTYYAIPGQSIPFYFSATDDFGHSIAPIVTSISYILNTTSTTPQVLLNFTQQLGISDNFVNISSSNRQISVNSTLQLGNNGYYALEGENPTLTEVMVFANENEIVEGVFYTLDGGFLAQADIVVEVQTCPKGFDYNESSHICDCEDYLTDQNITCDARNLAFIVPRNQWLGLVFNDSEFAVSPCFLYCIREEKTVKIVNGTADYDSQCSTGQNRGGVGCGSCLPGYSLAIGSNKCLRCSNKYAALFVVFILFGIVLVATLAYLRITIAYGFLNGILLYSNIVSLYGPQLTPSDPYSGRLVITSFLTLNFGIESCLHDKLTALERVGWQLIFPLYLVILMLIITFLARFRKLKAISGQNIIQAFSTLMILAYVSVLQASVNIISVHIGHTSGGSRLLRWHIDPTVAYFHGLHGLLASIAILLLLLYIILFPIILFFPACLYRSRQLSKLKPFYDALWNPFKPACRRWLSCRLVFRWIPFVLADFTDPPENTFFTGLLIIVQLFILVPVRPFENFWVNTSDGLLLLNLSLLFTGALYYDAKVASLSGDERDAVLSQATHFSTALVTLAYLQFLAVFLYHLVGNRFPQLQEKLTNLNPFRRSKFGNRLLGKRADVSVVLTESAADDIDKEDSTEPHEMRSLPMFTELREPLLQEGYGDVVSAPPLHSGQ